MSTAEHEEDEKDEDVLVDAAGLAGWSTAAPAVVRASVLERTPTLRAHLLHARERRATPAEPLRVSLRATRRATALAMLRHAQGLTPVDVMGLRERDAWREVEDALETCAAVLLDARCYPLETRLRAAVARQVLELLGLGCWDEQGDLDLLARALDLAVAALPGELPPGPWLGRVVECASDADGDEIASLLSLATIARVLELAVARRRDPADARVDAHGAVMLAYHWVANRDASAGEVRELLAIVASAEEEVGAVGYHDGRYVDTDQDGTAAPADLGSNVAGPRAEIVLSHILKRVADGALRCGGCAKRARSSSPAPAAATAAPTTPEFEPSAAAAVSGDEEAEL